MHLLEVLRVDLECLGRGIVLESTMAVVLSACDPAPFAPL